jgi:hypothetical protein
VVVTFCSLPSFAPQKGISAKHALLSSKRAKGQKDLPSISVHRTSEKVLDRDFVSLLPVTPVEK